MSECVTPGQEATQGRGPTTAKRINKTSTFLLAGFQLLALCFSVNDFGSLDACLLLPGSLSGQNPDIRARARPRARSSAQRDPGQRGRKGGGNRGGEGLKET